jgi:microsomal dipeptidase-like Zn-dependent dipeptidase
MNTEDELPDDDLSFADFHCHSSMKPFGQAFPGNTNSADASLKNSIWHDDPPNLRKMMLENRTGITRFSQSNFTALSEGKFKIVVVALSPIEKGFFPERIKRNPVQNLIDQTVQRARSSRLILFLEDFMTGIGQKKIEFIRKNFDDFNELNCEYEFYRQLDNIPLTIYGKKIRYRLSTCHDDIAAYHRDNNGIISVVLSIEGANLFNNDNRRDPDHRSVLANIDIVKNWQHPPFFVTLCHHFYNYLGGHARSLPGILNNRIDDRFGSDKGLLPLGEKVIDHLLSKTNGRRIYIDIKHMNRLVRKAYYKILDEKYSDEQIPIIVSHGALNGYASLPDAPEIQSERNGLFNGRDINFYDDEIVRIAKSGGIFGLQLDMRQITNRHEKRKIMLRCKKNRPKRWLNLVWNQIRHIADLLDGMNIPAWNIICLGTDFDGIISPIDKYCTSDKLQNLFIDLLPYAEDYMTHKTFRFSPNLIPAKVILRKIFYENADAFLKKYY